MNIKLVNYETKEKIASLQLAGNANDRVFNTIEEIERMQETKDILGVGRLGKTSFGIRRMYTRGCRITSMDPQSTTVITGRMSCELMPDARTEDTTPPDVTIDGESIGLKVGIVLYDTGWILNTGVDCYNIFGAPSPAYLISIGSRRIKSGAASSARRFKTLRDVASYVEKYKGALEYMVTTNGYNWSCEPSCNEFLEDYEAGLTAKQSAKYDADRAALREMLDAINSPNTTAKQDKSNIPETVTDNEVNEEILYRMRKENFFTDGILSFKKNSQIFQSEAGGILYHLDEGAEEAVRKAKDFGTPWHVIKNVYNEIGTVYTVLYVSQEPECWPEERTDSRGEMTAFCWNATQSFGEVGLVRIHSVNGGFVRVA